MEVVAVAVNSKHRVVIPKAVRKALGVGPRDSLLFVIDGGSVAVRIRPASLTTALRGLHADLWSARGGCMDERSSWE